jgi:hypothetical protein
MGTLPTIFTDESGKRRLIQGSLLRCVDGVWTARDETLDPKDTFLALGTITVLQCWQDSVPTATEWPDERGHLPDVETLNEQIPEDEWEEDMNGAPRPPWVVTHAAYLLRPSDGAKFTFANSTVGASIAVEKLGDKVKSMQLLHGNGIVPTVQLGARPMTTKFGIKQRPSFDIISWVTVDGSGVRPAMLEKKPLEEDLNDALPDFSKKKTA